MYIRKITFIITVLLIVFLSISYLSYPLVGPDSSYYLSITREFYNGKIYFVDIATAYNPLAVIILGLPFLFFDHPDPRLSLMINMLVIWASSYLIYSILQKINNNKKENLFYAIFFVLGSLLLDGKHIMLEPISVFFQLLGLLFYLMYKDSEKHNYLIFVGVSVALSFLSKQYGLFILAPIGIDILIHKRTILKNSLLISIGFSLPIVLFYLYLNKNGVSISEFINYILGKGLKLDKGNGTGINYSLTTYLTGFVLFIFYNLYLLIIPILIIKNRKKIKYMKWIFVSILPFSILVLFSASYPHYFQYVLPYAIITFAYLIYTSEIQIVKYKEVALFISTLIISAILLFNFNKRQEKIDLQKEYVKQISSIIPKKSKVYLDGASPALYYLCHFQSIKLNTIGFTFPGYFYPQTIVKNMEVNSYLVLTKEAYLSYKDLVSSFSKKEISFNNETYLIIKKE